MARCSCAGDSDPQLLAARAGLARLAGPPPVRKRMRRGRLLHVLAQCITEERYLEGAAMSLAYVFGLRVPSELIAQARAGLFAVRGSGKIIYGPIRRKGKRQLSYLCRYCSCSSEPLLCPHPWVAWLQEQVPTGLCFGFNAKQFMRRLEPFLLASGVPSSELHL